MRETIDRMLANLRDYFSRMTPQIRRRLLILTGAVIALAIIIVAFLSRTVWVPLPGAMSTIDPSAISATLAEIGIPTKMDGYIIQVPQESSSAAVEHLRERGLIVDPSFSDRWIQEANAFGVSDNHAKQLYDLAAGDQLRTMLLQNPRIQNALVKVNSGETSPFRIQNNTRQATAVVQVTLNDGGTLSQNEAQTIADMVKNHVPGIEYENITISDNMLRNYTGGDGTPSFEEDMDQRIAIQNRLADQAKMQIENLFSPIFGLENLSVQPTVRLNFDTTVINSIEFGPPIPGSEEGMVRSSQEIYERSRVWANAEGIPGTDTNGMGTAEYPYGDFGENDIYMRDVINLNFDLNETRTAIEVAKGNIEHFSISIIINTDYLGEDVDAEPLDLTQDLIDLAANALGINKALITVKYAPFKDVNEAYERFLAEQRALEARQFRNWLIEQILKYGTIILLIIMVFMLIKSVLKGMQPEIEEEPLLADGPGSLDIMIGEGEGHELEEIDLNAKSASLEQIERFIDKDAASVTQLLRNWLTDE